MTYENSSTSGAPNVGGNYGNNPSMHDEFYDRMINSNENYGR